MKALRILIAAVSALGVLGGAAHAEIGTTFVHVNTVEIDSTAYNVYEMIVTPTYDWTNSVLEITLTTGEFYNHAQGSDWEPNPLLFGIFPDVEWDTYAATPSGESVPAAFTVDSQFGQNPATSDPPMGNTVIKAGWFDFGITGPGTLKVARLTLSSDAEGTIGGRSFNANPDDPIPDMGSFYGLYTITGGHIVPEPATLSLLALGGVAVLRRRSAQVRWRVSGIGAGVAMTKPENKTRLP